MKNIGLAVALAVTSGSAYAQYVVGDTQYTCPVGVPWNDPRCIRQALPQQQTHSQAWETRWGAIAFDGESGKFGYVNGMQSMREAKSIAIARCMQDGGGKGCDVNNMTYYNQCALIVWGDAYAGTYRAESIDVASRRALEICGARSSNCEIYAAGCSMPERVR